MDYTRCMRYDLAISDFDGTLLRRDDTISARTLSAIRAFTQKGGVFAVSTGRAFAGIAGRLGELELPGDVPVMCCQGALVRKVRSGETVSQIPLDTAAAARFLSRAERMGLMCQFYTPDAVYAPSRNEINDYYFMRNRIEPVAVGRRVSDCIVRVQEPVLKVLCFIQPSDRARMLQAFSDLPGMRVFASHPSLIEGVSVRAGKGNGLRIACRNLGVAPERTVAFGDELNDIDMLQAAGLGVAMGNAVPETKAAADTVTDDCDADGVAAVLERIANEQPIETKTTA